MAVGGVPACHALARLARGTRRGGDLRRRRWGGTAFGALSVSLAIAGILLVVSQGRWAPALDAVARLTGALLVVVAAGLVVDGVRAI